MGVALVCLGLSETENGSTTSACLAYVTIQYLYNSEEIITNVFFCGLCIFSLYFKHFNVQMCYVCLWENYFRWKNLLDQ